MAIHFQYAVSNATYLCPCICKRHHRIQRYSIRNGNCYPGKEKSRVNGCFNISIAFVSLMFLTHDVRKVRKLFLYYSASLHLFRCRNTIYKKNFKKGGVVPFLLILNEGYNNTLSSYFKN